MHLAGERRIAIDYLGEDVIFTLREPTVKELNSFLASRYSTKSNKFQDRSIQSRADFFDKLLTGVENLEDKEGKSVSPDRSDLIPLNWKTSIIQQNFEDVAGEARTEKK